MSAEEDEGNLDDDGDDCIHCGVFTSIYCYECEAPHCSNCPCECEDEDLDDDDDWDDEDDLDDDLDEEDDDEDLDL